MLQPIRSFLTLILLVVGSLLIGMLTSQRDPAVRSVLDAYYCSLFSRSSGRSAETEVYHEKHRTDQA
jgi:hypothetical protein